MQSDPFQSSTPVPGIPIDYECDRSFADAGRRQTPPNSFVAGVEVESGPQEQVI